MAGPRGNLRLTPDLGATLLVAAGILLLALSGGGSSPFAYGSMTVVVWLLVVAVAIPGLRFGGEAASPPFSIAVMLLATLLAFSALSLGWGSDDGAGFAVVVRWAGYLGVFVLIGLTLRRRSAAPVVIGLAAGGTAVVLVALGSRLLGLGGDTDLVATLPGVAGRLSYPIGYWNALGAVAALTFTLLVWVASEAAGPRWRGLALAAMPPALLTAYMTSSRGALLAAALGGAVVVSLGSRPRRGGAAILIGAAAAAPALVAAALGSGILETPGGSIGRAELGVLLALLAGAVAGLLSGGRALDRLSEVRTPGPRVPGRLIAAVALAAIAALVVVSGPTELVADFRSVPDESREGGAAVVSATGSGRAQFWGTALDAFADEPAKGIGAGGYENYWNQHGSLAVPVQNAHSEPLELLAELGAVGFLLFVGFLAVMLLSGTRRARAARGSPEGAALGVVVAGLVGISLDWTWDVPAVAVMILIAGAILTKPTLAGSVSGSRSRGRPHPSIPLRLANAAAIVVGVAAIWAGGILAVASSRLDASSDALARGEFGEAAELARSAAAVEPWASRPWQQLASVEQAAGNLDAAERDTEEAISRAPSDYEPWLLAFALQSDLDAQVIAERYLEHAQLLAPLLIDRAISATIAGT